MPRHRPPAHEPDDTPPEFRDRPVLWWWRLPLILLLPVAIAGRFLLQGHPEGVERVYSVGIYPYLSSLLGLVSDWSPVSLAEVGLLLLTATVFFRAFRALADAIRGQRTFGNVSMHGLANSLTLVGALVGFWFLFWGINYHRQPFAVTAGLDVEPVEAEESVDELEELCRGLAAEAGELRPSVALDADGYMAVSNDRADCLARVAIGFQRASKTHPVLGWNYAQPKLALLSPVLSWLGMTGIYSPLTGEPHVNRDVMDAELPFTAAHELAHQIGFAHENEANFIALLACRAHPDADFRYSGALEGLQFALGALAGAAPDRFAEVRDGLPEGVRYDLEGNLANWRRFESPARDVARVVNDSYLKSAGAAQGILSYGAVVDLMLAERRQR